LDGLAPGVSVSLDIRSLMTRFSIHEQITRLVCVEGWSAIAWWAGLRFDDLLRAYPPASQAKWVRVESSVNLDASPRVPEDPVPHGNDFVDDIVAETRLAASGIELPPVPPPFGPYVPAVPSGNLLFLTGMLPTVGHEPKFLGRAGKELDAEQGRRAAYAAALNVLAVARQHLGSLDRISRVVRLGVYIATAAGFSDHVTVADAASELLRDLLEEDKMPSRLVFGVESLPLSVPVELEVILEVSA
jgi:enamine deaminase RidA (YjgF/YER057c/UK114 family)